MAETQTQTQSKRQREEEEQELETHGLEETLNTTTNKRQKYSMNDILSFLDSSEEEEPSQDLSSLITTLQQELSSSSEPDPENLATSSSTSSSSEQEDPRESVMRHLLEASDDELGIPNINDTSFSGIEGVDFDQGLWELEDEAAFYYTLMQSELCM